MDEGLMRRWLGLTQQQFDVVKVIYRVRNRGVVSSPKVVQREYRTEHGKLIIKPNLFNILRVLQEKGVVRRVAQGEYALDHEGISNVMDGARVRLEGEREELDKTSGQVDQFFREVTYSREHPDVNYLEGKELYVALADAASKSLVFWATVDFPWTAYSPELAHAAGASRFVEALQQKLVDKKSSVNLLTTLSTESLFNHGFSAHGDPKDAYSEILNTVDHLATQVSSSGNLDVRYSDVPAGLDIAIAETQQPNEFILLIRDEHNDIRSGIRVRSHKTAANALQSIQKVFSQALRLKSPQGKAILKGVKSDIQRKYGILGDES